MLKPLRASLTELLALEFQHPYEKHIDTSMKHVFKLLIIAEPELVNGEKKFEVLISWSIL